jgi:CHASE3 domain sensor protein
MSEEPKSVVDVTLSELQSRSLLLKRTANGVLGAIVLVLVLGISLFLFAGTLANRESTALIDDRLREVNEFLASAQMQERASREDLSQLQDRLVRELSGSGGSNQAGEGPVADLIRSRIDEATRYHADAENSLRSLKEEAAELLKQRLEAEGGNLKPDQLPILVSSIATRIGAVVLLLFLVQILVPLYRYNVRLAAFYDGRRDALSLLESKMDGRSLSSLVTALSPDHLDFGKPPTTPSEQGFEVGKQLLQSRLK